MDIVAPFVADGEPPEPMEPGERTFHHPAEDPEPAAMRTAGLGDDRDNALRREAGVTRLRPISAIALDHPGFALGPTASAGDRRQGGDHRFELGDVVHVGGGELGEERHALGVGQKVMFRAFLTAIGWVRSSFFPPRIARTDALSITVQR